MFSLFYSGWSRDLGERCIQRVEGGSQSLLMIWPLLCMPLHACSILISAPPQPQQQCQYDFNFSKDLQIWFSSTKCMRSPNAVVCSSYSVGDKNSLWRNCCSVWFSMIRYNLRIQVWNHKMIHPQPLHRGDGPDGQWYPLSSGLIWFSIKKSVVRRTLSRGK